VQARDLGPVGGFASTQTLLSWVHTHTLWVADAHGAGARELHAAGTGIYQPQWSRDGSHLLYIRDDAVWLIGANGMAPARIVGPFPTKAEYVGYYGHVYWPQYIALAWYRR
jgi:TolB protein